MHQVLHKSASRLAGDRMRRILVSSLVSLACLGAVQTVRGQGYPGGGQMPGGRGGMSQAGAPSTDSPQQSTEKPDAAAKKAFNAGVKSLNRAREFEEVAAKATNPDKKAGALEKVGDAYSKALDQFTEALSNKGDMVEAWNYAGFVHLRLGAYNESIDDYNHTLALKPDLLEAIETSRRRPTWRSIAWRKRKAAYMDLFNHARPLADHLMVAMQKWLEIHRAAANGMRAADIDSFGKWLQERDGIAKQTASASAAIPSKWRARRRLCSALEGLCQLADLHTQLEHPLFQLRYALAQGGAGRRFLGGGGLFHRLDDAREQMRIAGLARAGGPRQSSDERTVLARHQTLERGFDLLGIGEFAQSVGARAQLAGRLRSAQQQYANDAEFLL